ncbi:MAG: hypothetical protein LBO77_05885 [Desulfovibrio sp.]|jgi:hypothetical protein|nr:hypothetical protein [Desulfovibrio sp.]
MIAKFFLYILISLSLLIAACSLPRVADRDREASDVWRSFTAKAAAAENNTGPFRVAGSLRFTDADGSNRASFLLWGNGSPAAPWPLRLDLIAGAGNVVAKIHETDASFLAYIPGEQTAFAHKQGPDTLPALGVPIPLRLRDLALLLTGRCGVLFLNAGKDPKAAPLGQATSGQSFAFPLSLARLTGILELSPSGEPLAWREDRADGWSIRFEPGEDSPLLARRLHIENAGRYSALIVVKEFHRLSDPFSPRQLALSLPPDTRVRDLNTEILFSKRP